MMHVILFSSEDAPSVRLLGALREAGIEVAAAPEGDRAGFAGRGEEPAAGSAGEGSPVAVVYEVACGADVAALYAAVARAVGGVAVAAARGVPARQVRRAAGRAADARA